jgi:hypothetical protein
MNKKESLALKASISWSYLSVLSTVVILACVIGINVQLLLLTSTAAKIGGLFVVDSVVLCFALILPLRIVLTDTSIRVWRLIGYFEIPYIEVVAAESISPYADLRIVGSYGLFGFLGIFRNEKFGWYYSLTCNMRKSFIICTKSSKGYVFSTRNNDKVLAFIAEKTGSSIRY